MYTNLRNCMDNCFCLLWVNPVMSKKNNHIWGSYLIRVEALTRHKTRMFQHVANQKAWVRMLEKCPKNGKNPVIDRKTLNMRLLNQKKIQYASPGSCIRFLNALTLANFTPPEVQPVRVLVGSPKRDILEAWFPGKSWRNWHTNKQQQSHPKWCLRTPPKNKAFRLFRPYAFVSLGLFLRIFKSEVLWSCVEREAPWAGWGGRV